MKKCLQCAEEIQYDARVCKHCGRDVVSASIEPRGIRGLSTALAAGVLLAVGGFGLVTWQHDRIREAEALESTLANERAQLASAILDSMVRDSIKKATPVFFPVADSDAQEIPAGKFFEVKFAVPDLDRNCKVVGSVRGLAGGNKDVAVYLLTPEQLVDWRASPARDPHTSWEAFKDSTVTVDYQLYGGGDYYLVVSNGFSVFTSKTVQIKTRVKCTSDARPVIGE